MSHLQQVLAQSKLEEEQQRVKREQEFKVLQQAIKSRNFRVMTNVPYDGNCFFHAIVKQQSNFTSGSSLRKSLLAYLKSTVSSLLK